MNSNKEWYNDELDNNSGTHNNGLYDDGGLLDEASTDGKGLTESNGDK